jgi:hypothetical protein
VLQINLATYASDALEDAMRLAQTKALNSYSWSDMLNYLNYSWMDIYQKIAEHDEGFYSRTIQLTKRLTKLPPFLKSTIRIYAAQRPVGFNREIFRASGYNDLQGISTYHISGFDLYCPDAERRTVWLNYVPMQPMIFFTRNNRDPELIGHDVERSADYNLYSLVCLAGGVDVDITSADSSRIEEIDKYEMQHKNSSLNHKSDVEITDLIHKEEWKICYISCKFPYIFITYRHEYTNEYLSGFYPDIMNTVEFVEYNPFAFTGHNSNVEYITTDWNDKTGLGVTIIDHNDQDRYKYLGWTPDTLLNYPSPEMYRLLVARLADKLSVLNESNIMGVQRELTEANYAFANYIDKDQSSWVRIDNVNGPTMADML